MVSSTNKKSTWKSQSKRSPRRGEKIVVSSIVVPLQKRQKLENRSLLVKKKPNKGKKKTQANIIAEKTAKTGAKSTMVSSKKCDKLSSGILTKTVRKTVPSKIRSYKSTTAIDLKVDFQGELEAVKERSAILENENRKINELLREKKRILNKSKLNLAKAGLKLEDFLSSKKLSELKSREETLKIRAQYTEMLQDVQGFTNKVRVDLEKKHERHKVLQEKMKASSELCEAHETELREKTEIVEQEKLKLLNMKKLLVIEQRKKEKTLQ